MNSCLTTPRSDVWHPFSLYISNSTLSQQPCYMQREICIYTIAESWFETTSHAETLKNLNCKLDCHVLQGQLNKRCTRLFFVSLSFNLKVERTSFRCRTSVSLLTWMLPCEIICKYLYSSLHQRITLPQAVRAMLVGKRIWEPLLNFELPGLLSIWAVIPEEPRNFQHWLRF